MVHRFLLVGLLVAAVEGQPWLEPNNGVRYPRIGHYQPEENMATQLAIDQDLITIMDLVGNKQFMHALTTYEQGGSSSSIAILTLSEELDADIPLYSKITGTTESGNEVVAYTLSKHEAKSNTFEVKYDVQFGQTEECKVGGLAASNREKIEGCFAPNGTISVEQEFGDPMILSYSYNPKVNNRNDHNFWGLSKFARSTMMECVGGCPYEDFIKYYNYYGTYTYGDLFVKAAIWDKTTESYERGQVDFKKLPGPQQELGRADAVVWGIVVLSTWMAVVRQYELALDLCVPAIADFDAVDNAEALYRWEEGVALYAGMSLISEGTGSLMYSVADDMCEAFGTCSQDGNHTIGIAHVNYEIMGEWAIAKQNLMVGNCVGARQNKERIVKLMTVPLIQGALVYSYALDSSVHQFMASSGDYAASSAFVTAVAPLVHHCSPSDAAILQENFAFESTSQTSFVAVKEALERNYKCLGVTCAQVGGVLENKGHTYRLKAGPCVDEDLSESTTNEILGEDPDDAVDFTVVLLASTTAIFGAICISMFVLWALSKPTNNARYQSGDNKPEEKNALRGQFV